jgi:hypothetical protein
MVSLVINCFGIYLKYDNSLGPILTQRNRVIEHCLANATTRRCVLSNPPNATIVPHLPATLDVGMNWNNRLDLIKERALC